MQNNLTDAETRYLDELDQAIRYFDKDAESASMPVRRHNTWAITAIRHMIAMMARDRSIAAYKLRYRGYDIVVKRDFGDKPFLIDGMPCMWGYVVCNTAETIETKGQYAGTNAMPGAILFQTVKAAKRAIDALIDSYTGTWERDLPQFDTGKFYAAIRDENPTVSPEDNARDVITKLLHDNGLAVATFETRPGERHLVKTTNMKGNVGKKPILVLAEAVLDIVAPGVRVASPFAPNGLAGEDFSDRSGVLCSVNERRMPHNGGFAAMRAEREGAAGFTSMPGVPDAEAALRMRDAHRDVYRQAAASIYTHFIEDSDAGVREAVKELRAKIDAGTPIPVPQINDLVNDVVRAAREAEAESSRSKHLEQLRTERAKVSAVVRAFLSHKASWRRIIQDHLSVGRAFWATEEGKEDIAYMEHELKAFDEAFSAMESLP